MQRTLTGTMQQVIVNAPQSRRGILPRSFSAETGRKKKESGSLFYFRGALIAMSSVFSPPLTRGGTGVGSFPRPRRGQTIVAPGDRREPGVKKEGRNRPRRGRTLGEHRDNTLFAPFGDRGNRLFPRVPLRSTRGYYCVPPLGANRPVGAPPLGAREGVSRPVGAPFLGAREDVAPPAGAPFLGAREDVAPPAEILGGCPSCNIRRRCLPC